MFIFSVAFYIENLKFIANNRYLVYIFWFFIRQKIIEWYRRKLIERNSEAYFYCVILKLSSSFQLFHFSPTVQFEHILLFYAYILYYNVRSASVKSEWVFFFSFLLKSTVYIYEKHDCNERFTNVYSLHYIYVPSYFIFI